MLKLEYRQYSSAKNCISHNKLQNIIIKITQQNSIRCIRLEVYNI